MKKLKLLLSVILSVVLFIQYTYACTPVGCMNSAHHQDTLIIGEVKSVANGVLKFAVIFVFPQNKIKLLRKNMEIVVKTTFIKNHIKDPAKEKAPQFTVGKKYLLSLNKETNWFSSSFYYPAWGLFEVSGDQYSNMKLIKYKGFEASELQALLNSGGIIK